MQLLQKARAGSKSDLGFLLEFFRPALLAHAHWRNPPGLRRKRADSDLVQETLCNAERHFSQFSGETMPQTKAWLLRILENNLRDHEKACGRKKRDAGREVALDGLEASLAGTGPTAEEAALRVEEEEILHAALDRLTADDRVALRLRFFEQLSYQELGSELGGSGAEARSACARALQHLGQELRW